MLGGDLICPLSRAYHTVLETECQQQPLEVTIRIELCGIGTVSHPGPYAARFPPRSSPPHRVFSYRRLERLRASRDN